MTCSRLKDKLAAGGTAFGVWTSMTDPMVIEIVANAGYDYISIDMEHSPLNTESVINLMRVANGCGMSALVRVPEEDPGMVLRVADMGPDGMYMPHIRNAEDAKQMVKLAKYRPIGDRGASQYSRAANYGMAAEQHPSDFRQRINDNLLLWMQIEEKSAVEDIENIVKVPGVDICGIAPHDLSRSLGVKADSSEPALMEAARHVAKVVKASKSTYLAAPATVFGLEGALALGAQICNLTDVAAAMMGGLRDKLRQAQALKR